jgi:hypothetical protein
MTKLIGRPGCRSFVFFIPVDLKPFNGKFLRKREFTVKKNLLFRSMIIAFLLSPAAWADQIGGCQDDKGHNYSVQYEASGIATTVSYKDDSGKRIFQKNPLLENTNFVTTFSFPNGITFVVGNMFAEGNAYLFTDYGQTSFSLACKSNQ